MSVIQAEELKQLICLLCHHTLIMKLMQNAPEIIHLSWQ